MIKLYLSGLFPCTLRFGGYNFVDVRDVAKGMIAAAEKGRGGECYFLCGDRLSVTEFIEALAKIEGKPSPKIALTKGFVLKMCPVIEVLFKAAKLPPVLTPFSINKLCENCNFSYEKAVRELDYSPMSAEDSLRDTIKWMKENRKGENTVSELTKNIEDSIQEAIDRDLKYVETNFWNNEDSFGENYEKTRKSLKKLIDSRKWNY